MLGAVPSREFNDRCPGVLRPFTAADGVIVRLRLPGGRSTARELADICRLAETFGAPFLQLTSRGNLQLRGVTEPLPEALVAEVARLGLLPSATHERARNIVADPSRELDALVNELDDGLQRNYALSALPGRWLFAIADSSGHALTSPYDVAYQRLSATDGLLLLGHRSTACSPQGAPSHMLDLAQRFLEDRPDERTWNVRDLPEDSALFSGFVPRRRTDQPDGTRSERCELGVPLGFLTPTLAQALVGVLGEGARVVLSTRRSLTLDPSVGDDRLDALVAAGFVRADDPRRAVTACIGAPACRRTTSPTISIARDVPTTACGPRVHIVGCERACGRPNTPHSIVVDPRSTYDVLEAIGHS